MGSTSIEVGDDQEATLGDFIADRSTPPVDQILEDILLSEHFKDILATLSDKEKRVLELRFGVGTGEEHTQEDIGKEIGVSSTRVRQIEFKAIRKLRHPIRSRKVGYFLKV